MAFTYDVTTDRGKVRMLITDVESTDACFEDDEIDAYLTLSGSNVFGAAGYALLTIAANEALVSKRIKLLDLTTDGPAVAESLRKLAAEYMEIASAGDETFDYAEYVQDQFSYRNKIAREALRSG